MCLGIGSDVGLGLESVGIVDTRDRSAYTNNAAVRDRQVDVCKIELGYYVRQYRILCAHVSSTDKFPASALHSSEVTRTPRTINTHTLEGHGSSSLRFLSTLVSTATRKTCANEWVVSKGITAHYY